MIEALAVVELVDINWPRANLSDETKKAWAREIAEREPNAIAADGYEAVRDLAAHQTYPPAVAEVIVGIRGARLSRPAPSALPEPSGEFPSFAEHLRANPDQAAKIRGLKQDREHADSPIPAGIEQLFVLSGVKAEDKVDRARKLVREGL